MTVIVGHEPCCIENCWRPARGLDVACTWHLMRLVTGNLDAEGQRRIAERRAAQPESVRRLRENGRS